jgi:D-alanine--poly(phosphoribitol) ligase subunit 2
MKEKIIEMIISLTEYDELQHNPDVNLIEEDILDSLAFIELIEELENEFDIEIQPTQVSNDTWEYVDNIVTMVESLMKK